MQDAEGSDDRVIDGIPSRWARVGFALACGSALVYFASSQGIRNFVGFLFEGVVKLARLLGLSA